MDWGLLLTLGGILVAIFTPIIGYVVKSIHNRIDESNKTMESHTTLLTQKIDRAEFDRMVDRHDKDMSELRSDMNTGFDSVRQDFRELRSIIMEALKK